jgi:hypothetical protein
MVGRKMKKSLPMRKRTRRTRAIKRNRVRRSLYPISKVLLKWTMHKNNNQASYFQWTNDGIKRFNTMYDIVKERRARQVAIDDAYLKSLNKAKVVQTKKLEGEMNLCRQDW